MLRAIVLGIVQGLTEFLPISSSAHLSIVPKLLGYATPTLAFEVLLHFGTLAAVVAYFARDLWAFLLSLVAPGRLGREEAAVRRRLLGLLALASVPAAVVGFLLQDWADQQTARPLRAAVWLVLTTAIMIAAELYDRARARRAVPVVPVVPVPADAADGRVGTRAERFARGAAAATPPEDSEEELKRLPVTKATGIGLAQAVALIPGTSRSGVTISTGLFLGVSRATAARFSFLLSIPAILGAGILKLGDLSGATETPAELLAGTLAAAISGFLAVSFLIRMLRTRTLWPFIWYRLIAGTLFVLLLATVRS
ncbi:MAG TPA: undecaprenyl-diphosphate phosphatase [Actinomycetota bacterium]|nr:undecaprenyl-diphosphate phosphatase [Actinomycetota bacterium]